MWNSCKQPLPSQSCCCCAVCCTVYVIDRIEMAKIHTYTHTARLYDSVTKGCSPPLPVWAFGKGIDTFTIQSGLQLSEGLRQINTAAFPQTCKQSICPQLVYICLCFLIMCTACSLFFGSITVQSKIDI